MQTLFVLPLNQKYVCSVHNGVLEDPVTDSTGRSVCRRCNTSTDFVPNPSLQEEINSLLCYCKYGVTRNSNNELTPISHNQGCEHILKYGTRLAHEATCAFNKEQTLSPPLPASPPLGRVPYEDLSASELRKLLEDRDAHIATLEQEILARDKEIGTLRFDLNEVNNPAASFVKRTSEGTKELWEDLVKILVEDIPQNVSNAHSSIVHSTRYQKSIEALSSLKDRVAKTTQTVGQQAAELHPIEKFISTLTELRDELVHNVKNTLGKKESENETSDNNNNNSTANNSSISASQDDVEYQKLLQESLASFEEEEKARKNLEQAEAAAVLAATDASLNQY